MEILLCDRRQVGELPGPRILGALGGGIPADESGSLFGSRRDLADIQAFSFQTGDTGQIGAIQDAAVCRGIELYGAGNRLVFQIGDQVPSETIV